MKIDPNPTFRPGLKAAAPSAEDMIEDLMAHHVATDPKNRYGFNERELWDWRLNEYGYGQLISDWLLTATER